MHVHAKCHFSYMHYATCHGFMIRHISNMKYHHLSLMRSATCLICGCQVSNNSYCMHVMDDYCLWTQNSVGSPTMLLGTPCGYMQGHARKTSERNPFMLHAIPPSHSDSQGELEYGVKLTCNRMHASLPKLKMPACHMQRYH